MKKLLGISLVAVLSATPLMAFAVADGQPIPGDPGQTVTDATAAANATATNSPKYGLVTADSTKDGNVATAGYVKGAYNAAIKAVNAVAEEVDSKQDIINDLSDIRTNAAAGAGAAETISHYGDIVTHDADEFLTTTDLNGVATTTGVVATVNAASATYTPHGTVTQGTIATVNDWATQGTGTITTTGIAFTGTQATITPTVSEYQQN